MITISALAILGITAVGFVGLPLGMSLFCKNQKVNKVMSVIGMIAYSAFALFLALPGRAFENFMLTLNFNPSTPWFNRMFSLGIGALDPFEVAVNCLMLAPLGFMASQYAKAKNKKTLKRALFAGFLLSLAIEICQMILPFGRYPTVIDICWNVLSAGIGCACFNVCHKIKDFFVRRKKKKILAKEVEKEECYSLCESKVRTVKKQKLNKHAQSFTENKETEEIQLAKTI